MAKDRCYPKNICVTDYTATSISTGSHYNKTFGDTDWCSGFDGSSGHSIYKQTCNDNECTRNLKSKESLFITCFVPLELSSIVNDKKIILWRNSQLSSTLYCQPLRFKFVEETADLLRSEELTLKNKIKQLTKTSYILLNGKPIDVDNKIEITMIDRKAHTALSDVTDSSQCCSLCGVSPKEMNDIDKVLLKLHTQNELQYGISTLHAWIRTFECLIHIAYKLPVKKWSARLPADKQQIEMQKKKIQLAFQEKIGLIVDRPKAGGSGTSNDGNTSRRAFQNEQLFSEITGLNFELIKMFHVVLTCISCGFELDAVLFREYCTHTARFYVECYPRYYMPQSIHKMLVYMTLPIGLFSEEAIEAQNKDFKKYREHFTRKCDRIKCNEDLFKRLFYSSDPVISSLRRIVSTKKKVLPEGVLQLLKNSV
ncbi:uncharacterized protein LOC136093223 [Hydra vulgaris]|uniref:uncharacterized protein LOC136093223 n=1 Tax=Hydra vulgaris TaxID=6087 RepID=UPI0032EA14AC